MHVPAISFIAMAMSAILSIGVPIALFFVVRKRYGRGIRPVIVGVVGYLLFAVILKQVLHWLVLETGVIAPMEHPYLYMLYGVLAAGVYEETSRFVSFRLLKRRCEGFGTALKHGIGHGGLEAFLVVGAPMISNLALAALINTQGAQGQETAATPTAQLFLSGAKCLMALAVHISLSAIVYYAVYQPRKVWLYPLAILLHALVNCAPALMQAGVIANEWLADGIVMVTAAGIAAVAVLLHKRLEPKETP